MEITELMIKDNYDPNEEFYAYEIKDNYDPNEEFYAYETKDKKYIDFLKRTNQYTEEKRS